MSNEIQSVNPVSETHFTRDQIELLKNTVCKGASDDEFKIFCYAIKRTGLDPFMRQIHAVKRWNAKAQREDMSIQVGIDGYRLIADRTGLYAGNDEAIFDNEKQPNKATVTVYKMVQGTRCPFTATARWSEYFPGEKQGFMWKKMPCVMLGKVAEALALRKAFPAELSGLYTEDEMAQADKEKTPPKEVASDILVEDEKILVAAKTIEFKKIKALKDELKISDLDLKAEVHQLCGKEDARVLSLAELKKVVELLEEEKFRREHPTAHKEPEHDPNAPWLQDTAGPLK